MTAPRMRRGAIPLAGPRAPTAPRGMGGRLAAPVQRVQSLFAGVHWSLAFIAFAAYVYSITSYKVAIGTEAMVVALLTLPMERTGLRFAQPMAWMIAFVAWSALGVTMTDYPELVWNEVIELAKIAAVMFVATNVITTRARFRFFLVFMLGICAAYPVRGTLINYFLVGETLVGRAIWNHIYSNPNDLAAYCLLSISLTFALLANERTRWIRVCAGLGEGILALIILLTQSRGAFVGAALFGLIAFRERMKKFKRLIMPAIAGMIILMFVPDSAWKRFGTIGNAADGAAISNVDAGSAEARMQIWKVAVAVIQDNPITGVGWGAYQEAHYRMALGNGFGPLAFGRRDAHSTYLRVMAETGIVGFACFAGLIVATLVRAERQRRRSRATHPELAIQLGYLELGLVAFLIAGIWGSYGNLVFLYLHLSLIHVGTQLLAGASKQQAPTPRGRMLPGRSRPADGPYRRRFAS